MSEPENEPTLFPVSPEQGPTQELTLEESEPGLMDEAGRQVQVLRAVGDYFATKRKRK